MTTAAPSAIRGLYAVTPDCADTGALLARVQQAFAGGARLLQYRNKAAPAALRLEQARALRALCDRYGAILIVNDDLEAAQACGADGVHLGQGDAPLAEARRRLGAGRIIGATCHDRLELAAAAQRAGADYVAFGSFFASTVKPQAPRADLALLRQARRRLRLPIVAIGGITPENAPGLIGAGADAVAALSALFGAADVAAAARRFCDLFELAVDPGP